MSDHAIKMAGQAATVRRELSAKGFRGSDPARQAGPRSEARIPPEQTHTAFSRCERERCYFANEFRGRGRPRRQEPDELGASSIHYTSSGPPLRTVDRGEAILVKERGWP